MFSDIIQKTNSLYAAFDRFPSSKGAAAHMYHFVSTLFEFFDGGLLYTAGSPGLPSLQYDGNSQHIRSSYYEKNYLLRALAHCRTLEHIMPVIVSDCKLAHFRDPWSGGAICNVSTSTMPLVYEVNGFPSIELLDLYPDIQPHTIDRIIKLEQMCLDRANVIVTPSRVTAACIEKRSIDKSKIRVIPNGAEIRDDHAERIEQLPLRYIVYFGALQKWQGVDLLIKAFSQLRDFEDVYLVICSSVNRKKVDGYSKFARKAGCADRIIWMNELDKNELYRVIANAQFTVAPLRDVRRNVEQGCCPLKILESMAAGTPVIASNLPVVNELFEDGVHGMKIRSDRHEALAQAMRVFLEYPALVNGMRLECKEHVRKNFSWKKSCSQLIDVYDEFSNSAIMIRAS
ncbi:MAG: glycosyltransferase family 4 protein [Fibrobacterota bacterium]|nr:glycosyltransferase family 4 protein [Chitinispirillaceae bacterium]